MGKLFFDLWTVGHFFFGVLTTSALIPSNPLLSLIITNVIHLLMELNENNIDETNGNILETKENHIGDIIFFFLGSLIGFVYGYHMFEKNYILRITVLLLSALTLLQEVLREIYPYDWYFDSAYKPFGW